MSYYNKLLEASVIRYMVFMNFNLPNLIIIYFGTACEKCELIKRILIVLIIKRVKFGRNRKSPSDVKRILNIWFVYVVKSNSQDKSTLDSWSGFNAGVCLILFYYDIRMAE